MLDPLEFGHDLAAAVASLRACTTVLAQDPGESRDLVREMSRRGRRARASFRAGADLGVWLKQSLRDWFGDYTFCRQLKSAAAAHSSKSGSKMTTELFDPPGARLARILVIAIAAASLAIVISVAASKSHDAWGARLPQKPVACPAPIVPAASSSTARSMPGGRPGVDASVPASPAGILVH